MNQLAIGLVAMAAAAVTAAQTQAPAPAPEASPQQAPAPESEADRAAVVAALASALDENFVFPDVARRYSEMLRARAAAGAYANLGPRFAETLEGELQALHADRHLRIGSASPSGPAGPGPRRVMRMPDPSSAIGQSGWIADGVAYVDIGLFPGNPETVARFERFLEQHSDARVLIFDIRNHRGGGLAEMDAIFSWIYPRETLLVGMDTRSAVVRRRGEPIPDGPTLRRVASPDTVVRRMHYAVPSARATRLREAQVYVLTSRRSGSAAEHFALSLKRTGRATLVGETTAGAGHYGGMVPLGHGYSAFIPVGRTYDPDTDQGWEAVGVAPNFAVPAGEALDEALRRAGVDPARRRTLGSS